MLRGIGKALRCSLGCRRLARSPFSRAQAENCEAGTGLAFLLASLVCTTSNVLQIFFKLNRRGRSFQKKCQAYTRVAGGDLATDTFPDSWWRPLGELVPDDGYRCRRPVDLLASRLARTVSS
jgi:hypothetical protein